MSSRDPDADSTWHTRRFSIPVPGTFDDVVRRFEDLVPAAAGERLTFHVERRSSWSEVVADVQSGAPHRFLVYWRAEVDHVMSLAGNAGRCVAYLVGNHVIAERMFRHDERVMNYAPLRMELTQHRDDAVRLTVDQPSTQFDSFGLPEISAVGRELDALLADVIRELGATVPPSLTARS